MEVTAEQLVNPSFWRRIAPGLNVDGTAIGPRYELPESQLDFVAQEIHEVGYGQLDGALPTTDVTDAFNAVKAVRSAGLLPIYAFMYDEAWGIYVRLAQAWRRILGPDWQFMPAIWVWWIEPGYRNAGFVAHRDRGRQQSLRADGTPMSLSAWVPLTRAIPSNGCMYIMPRDLEFEKLDSENCRKIRALPCGPGTVLIWNQSVWHWSGNSSPRAPNPRVAMAFELQAAPSDEVPVFQGPLLDPLACPPPMNERLSLIARQVLQYRHLTRLEGPPVELASAVLKIL